MSEARRTITSPNAPAAIGPYVHAVAAGATLADVVRATVYMTDLGAFAPVNDVYERFFPTDPPARAAIGVSELPKGSLVEVDAIVALPAADRLGS